MDANPIISRTLPDGARIETLFDPDAATTMLAVSDASGSVEIVPHYDAPTGERLIPYSPGNNLLATGCVLLPSAVGEVRDVRELVDMIRDYLARYVALSPEFTNIAPYYVLLSWVYDAFNELPYLRFRGDWGTGKTRALTTIGSICYKPFFASGASTVSPIFHILDAVGGTLVLDEADFRFSDATAELTKVLNNGNVKGWPVLRTMTNRYKELNPRAFSVFGPKLVGMRRSFDDVALESRFLTEETGRAVPVGVPIALPDTFASDARALRNDLLAWRFSAVASIGPKPERAIPDAPPRTNQIALPLLSLVDDPGVRKLIAAYLAREARATREAARDTDEARATRALHAAFGEATKAYVSVAEVARRFNGDAVTKPQFALTNKSVGAIIRTKLRIPTTKTRGVYVVPASARPRVEALFVRHGIGASAIPTSASAESETGILPSFAAASEMRTFK